MNYKEFLVLYLGKYDIVCVSTCNFLVGGIQYHICEIKFEG